MPSFAIKNTFYPATEVPAGGDLTIRMQILAAAIFLILVTIAPSFIVAESPVDDDAARIPVETRCQGGIMNGAGTTMLKQCFILGPIENGVGAVASDRAFSDRRRAPRAHKGSDTDCLASNYMKVKI